MTEINMRHLQPRIPNLWGSLLILTGLVLLGMVAGNVLAVGIVLAFWGKHPDLSVDNLQHFLQNPVYSSETWNAMMALQSIGHLFTFLVPALLYWIWVEHRRLKDFDFREKGSFGSIAPVLLLTIVLMPFTSMIAGWNESMQLPPALAGIEQWMKDNEENLARLTKFLVSFDSPFQLVIAIIVIALIPAWGEEVLFRGILQRKFAEHWASVHLAIWLSAAIFSAIHFQFYGFLPRMMLGALFGYLYFWTGRLGIAVFAHFINNAFTVLMIWMYRRQMITVDIESDNFAPPGLALFSAAISLALLVYLYRTQPDKRFSRVRDTA